MQKLCEAHGARTVVRALRFVACRLLTHALAEPIARELDQCARELCDVQSSYEEAHTERLAATAEVSYRDERVDEAVTILAKEVLRIVKDDRGDARYVALFPISPGEATASTAGARQHEFVHRLIAELRRNPGVQLLAAHADKLSLRQSELEQAMTVRDRCFAAEGALTRRLSEALDQACRSYNRTFSRLQLLCSNGPLIESMYPALAFSQRPESDVNQLLA